MAQAAWSGSLHYDPVDRRHPINKKAIRIGRTIRRTHHVDEILPLSDEHPMDERNRVTEVRSFMKAVSTKHADVTAAAESFPTILRGIWYPSQ